MNHERVETNQRKVMSPSAKVSTKCQRIPANWRFIRFIMGCLDITDSLCILVCARATRSLLFSGKTSKEVYYNV